MPSDTRKHPLPDLAFTTCRGLFSNKQPLSYSVRHSRSGPSLLRLRPPARLRRHPRRPPIPDALVQQREGAAERVGHRFAPDSP
jgi:hypothetical protein